MTLSFTSKHYKLLLLGSLFLAFYLMNLSICIMGKDKEATIQRPQSHLTTTSLKL